MADDGCARQSVSMPPPMLAALKREAKKRDLTVSQVVREKIREAQPQPRQPRRAAQVRCPVCKLWQARPGGNPGLIAGACQCDSKREAL